MTELIDKLRRGRAVRCARLYSDAFPDYPALAESRGWLSGTWMIGNNYRATNPLYGAYPPSYLKRVHSMFPDARKVLHLFSGGLKISDAVQLAWPDRWEDIKDRINLGLTEFGYWMELVDSKGPDEGRYPTTQCDVTALPEDWEHRFDLVLADPPYSADDAKKYGVKMPNLAKVMREAARVTRPGGNLIWLFTTFPMYRSDQWKLWGTIQLLRSTNHRVRGVFIFERQP